MHDALSVFAAFSKLTPCFLCNAYFLYKQVLIYPLLFQPLVDLRERMEITRKHHVGFITLQGSDEGFHRVAKIAGACGCIDL